MIEVKEISSEKEKLEIEIGNLTIAELLRTELWNDDSVKAAAWKREHPSKNPILLVKTSGKTPQKAIKDAITRIEKQLLELKSEVRKK